MANANTLRARLVYTIRLYRKNSGAIEVFGLHYHAHVRVAFFCSAAPHEATEKSSSLRIS